MLFNFILQIKTNFNDKVSLNFFLNCVTKELAGDNFEHRIFVYGFTIGREFELNSTHFKQIVACVPTLL